MRAYFASERPGALPLALCGLGGIGKTQLAVEYAYRYQQQYQAVLWARAASRDTLIADFVGVATHLQLSIEAEQDELQAVEALKHWLTEHTGWLLILDNADDLALAAEFLPTTGKGHMLLTSRVQATGRFASSLPVERLDEQEAMTLLLRRAGLLAMGASLESLALPTRTQALAIVHVMDSLPLALDQAGAYIEETASSLSEYLHLYQQRRSRLLARQSSLSSDYPYTVASAWALSFQRAEQANSAAADLLRLGAFLNPDAIPEVILTAGASFLGPVLGPVAADLLSLHEAIQVLRRYSLLKRDPEAKLLYIHRLVQAVLKDAMDPQMQRIWAERTIQAVNAAFPEASHGTWSLCRQLVPHALACAELINEYDLAFPEAARLLLQTGVYLEETGQLVQAQPLLQAALTMREQVLGPTHPDIAIILDHLAWIYCRQGKYEQSEALYQRALMITEHASGHMHPDLIFTLNHLAWLYMDQGRYAQAEALLQRSLAIKEYTSDAEDFKLADTLNDLARLHFLQGNYATSEALLQRVLSISERVQGPEHPDTAFIIASLAYFLRFQGKYEQSEVLHLRGLRILEQVLDPEHLEIAFSLDSLGSLYHLQGKYEQAIPLYERALAIREHVQGPEHPDTAGTLDNLALSFRVQGNYTQAEELHQRALAIRTQKLGPESLATVFSLVHLADLFLARQHYTQAEPLYQQALAIREQKLGPNHPDTATSLDRLAYLYYLQKQYTQAEPLYQRALEIRERMLGPEHPDTATTLDHLANLYQDQGQHRLAEPLYQRALAILEHVLGPEHPDTVSVHIRFTSLQEHLSSGAALQEPRSDAAKVLDTPPAKYPVRLTRREVEVLRMVAQGLTNAQIAAQLVLSEKTVINHLTHIFNKIGCDNRTAATAFAIRHHLA